MASVYKYSNDKTKSQNVKTEILGETKKHTNIFQKAKKQDILKVLLVNWRNSEPLYARIEIVMAEKTSP